MLFTRGTVSPIGRFECLPSSGSGRRRFIPCDCFDLVPLPALVKIDTPQFNLIIAACALPHLFCAKDFCVSTHGRQAFERPPLLNLPCSAELEMDMFYLILWEGSHLFRAESWGLPPHHKAH